MRNVALLAYVPVDPSLRLLPQTVTRTQAGIGHLPAAAHSFDPQKQVTHSRDATSGKVGC